MFNTRSVLALVVSLSLIGGTPAVLADPGNGKGNPHGNQMDGGKGNKGNKGNQGGHDNHGGPGNKGGGAGQKGNGGGNWDSGPRIDVGGVRVILGDNRGYWNPGPALPPGIQKNLAAARHRQETRRPPARPAAALRRLRVDAGRHRPAAGGGGDRADLRGAGQRPRLIEPWLCMADSATTLSAMTPRWSGG